MIKESQAYPSAVMGRYAYPLVFRDLAASWPALHKWTPEYLGKLGGDQLVNVVVGDRENNKPVFAELKLYDFFKRWHTDQPEQSQALYLKEFNLFEILPELMKDVDFSVFQRNFTKSWRYAWISQKDGRTNLHYDLLNNVLTQIVGEKLVTLIPPDQSVNLYPNTKFDSYARLSQVDAFNRDLVQFPNYQKALDAELQVILKPGDSVYIPSGWWHTARSLSPSISLAGFLARPIDYLTVLAPEELRLILHKWGIYKANNCTCCNVSASYAG